MRIIIAGGRDFSDYKLLEEKVDILTSNLSEVIIISGLARGADALGVCYAKNRDLEVIGMPADWKTHGRSAGYKRNVQMAEAADALIAFWDGKSRGTQHMINIASERGLPTRIIMY